MPSTSRQPLLSSAQGPGMSRRLSDTSLTSLDPSGLRSASSMSHRMGPSASGNSFSSTTRLGPTANLLGSKGGLPNSSGKEFASLNNGQDDDDDDMDDHLHTFTAAEKKDLSSPFDITSWRGWANAITLLVLLGAVIGIFGLYPLISFYYKDGSESGRNTPGYNLGGVNGTGQFPVIPGLPQLIDPDTPTDVYTKTGFDGNEWSLVFSDEFEVEGRSFYPGGKYYWSWRAKQVKSC
jgi:hypothetical protein